MIITSAIIFLVWSMSAGAAFFPFLYFSESSLVIRVLTVALAPSIFLLTFPLLMGVVSYKFQRGIIPGKFPRVMTDPIYFARRIYGTCWTQVYYFKPLYSVVLAIPIFKRLVFRLFGYRGPMDFTVYPDTWIRDLPLLKIGKGVYLSNRATLGTNICLSDGKIFVEGISIGERSLVGHLCIIGTGVQIDEGVEIGLRTSLGLKVNVGKSANVRPQCSINHGATLGAESAVGIMSLVGVKCVIGPGVKLPGGSNIPNGAILLKQEDAEKYFSSETAELSKHRLQILKSMTVGPHVPT